MAEERLSDTAPGLEPEKEKNSPTQAAQTDSARTDSQSQSSSQSTETGFADIVRKGMHVWVATRYVLRYLIAETCRGPPSDEQSSRTRARVTGRHMWPTCVRL